MKKEDGKKYDERFLSKWKTNKQTYKAVSLITRGDGNRYEVRIANIHQDIHVYLPHDVHHRA